MSLPAEIPPPRSLPFPAGPLLWPASSAASALGASHHQRIRLALAVLRREYQAVHEMQQPNSKLTGLMAQSTLAWMVHEQPAHTSPHASPAGEGRHPAASLLQLWSQRAGDRRADRAAQEDAAARFFASNLDNRWQRRCDVPLPAPRPTAGQQGSGDERAAAAFDHGGSGINPEVAAVLTEPGGGWRLLACLFLKLFHAHLAWLPTLAHSAALKEAQYAPALLLLQCVARGDLPAAPTASGLVLALPRIAPYWDPVNAGPWLPQALPACFLPEVLAAPATTLRQARRMLANRPGLACQVDAVHTLALDAAAQLTDLAAESRLGLTEVQHARRASHLLSAGRQWAQALKGGDDARIASLRTSKEFARDELLPRKALLLILATWMARRWSRFAHEAARDDALRPLPSPIQPAPARPVAGASA